VGCHPEGFERWAQPHLFADDMAIGAPPDTFFEAGQSWGLPPQLPQASRRDGHGTWRDLLTRAGEHASLLRVDHVMAVQRLWWIPDGVEPARGVYVRYPREELLAVIATCAALTGTTIVGEDLGTVPAEVEEALERWDVLGMYEEIFHTSTSPMPRIPARTVAGIRTHDMEPWASFVATHDLSGYRRRLRRHLGRPAGRTRGDLLDAVLERLARSDSWLVTVDLDDLVEETEPHNQPGRVTDTTWRRRNDRSLSAMLADPDVRRRLRVLGDRPRG
jgi:4-alpha-glucanotransferase